ncbi:MAG TPA: 16S rRNA (cytosine(1402)-N(4))-methyltransferase RsmH [Bacteroidia bacterium]|nr:16S rRNA (cytosine(1402)-N(4))-methyltransferase RsmH [Bacteroidia bacterium]
MQYHNPVLLHECITALNIRPTGVYVDVTYGGGGHSNEILKKLTTGKLYAFDQDEDALKNKIADDRLVLTTQNFKYMTNYLKFYKAFPVDGILADLGISSHQIDVPEKGFSTRFDAPLDMRMDKNSNKTASDVINSSTEEELKKIFSEYGEIKNAARLAWKICEARKKKTVNTVNDFKETMSGCMPRGKEHQYQAQVFQALRIYVNDELGALKEFLLQTTEALKPGGRLVVISYHSLEDRLVKNFIRSGKLSGEIEKDFYGNPLVAFKTITRKPIAPTEEELKINNRSRSAKLRIAEKI